MRKLNRPALIGMVLVGLVMSSAVAWADEDVVEVTETETTESLADTLFNFGYDLIHRVLLWNLSSLDGVYDCSLGDDPLTVTYGETSSEGLISVDNLEDADGVVSFPNRPPADVDPDLTPADEPILYNGADGDCGLSGAEVTGPQGQVNHGMFMKLFNSLWDGPGRGCVVRHLAGSDLGKGDQQIQAGTDLESEPVVSGDTATVDFDSAESDCEHGKGKKTDDETDISGASGGRPEHAGRPDHAGNPDDAGGQGSPGNSDSAPGHNK